MTQTWNWLKGKKTYIGLGVGAIVVIAHRLGVPTPGVQVDDTQIVHNLWMIAIAAAGRHGIG
jgi:hypothetical protein